MKAILVLACLALASADRKFFDSKNEFDKTVKGVLENMRTQLKNEEPMKLPRFTIQKRRMGFTILMKNLEMKQVDTFSILYINTQYPELKAKCILALPSATVEGEYQIDGVISGRRVSETRTFRMQPEEFEVTAFMRFEEERNSLQMKSMNLDWDFQDLKVKLENSDLEENEKDEVRQTISRRCLEMIKNNRSDILQRIERKLKDFTNQELEGKSKEEVLEMSKGAEKETTNEERE